MSTEADSLKKNFEKCSNNAVTEHVKCSVLTHHQNFINEGMKCYTYARWEWI